MRISKSRRREQGLGIRAGRAWRRDLETVHVSFRRRSSLAFMMMVMMMTMRCVAPATYILEDRAKSGTPHTFHFYQMWIDSRASRTSTGALTETLWQLTFLLHIHSRALRTPQQTTSRLNLHWHKRLPLLHPPREILTTIDPPYNPLHSDDAIPKTLIGKTCL